MVIFAEEDRQNIIGALGSLAVIAGHEQAVWKHVGLASGRFGFTRNMWPWEEA